MQQPYKDLVGKNQGVWERLYVDQPHAFRHYPNEELARFLGRHFLHRVPFPQRRALRILEVGCGNAANLWAVAKEGFSAYGMDGAPTSIGLARETLKRWGVEGSLSYGDLLALPYRDGAFDAVLDVVTHQCLPFAAHRVAYAEVARVLKTGGYFFSFHVGKGTWDYRNSGGRFIDRHTVDNVANPEAIFPQNGIVCMFPARDARALLRGAGLTCLALETLVKTYGNRRKRCQYLVMTSIKR